MRRADPGIAAARTSHVVVVSSGSAGRQASMRRKKEIVHDGVQIDLRASYDAWLSPV